MADLEEAINEQIETRPFASPRDLLLLIPLLSWPIYSIIGSKSQFGDEIVKEYQRNPLAVMIAYSSYSTFVLVHGKHLMIDLFK